MDSTNSNSSSISFSTNIYDRKFQVAFGIVGGVGTVIWAAQTGKTGKFWWWVGGSLVGQAIGFLCDGLSKK